MCIDARLGRLVFVSTLLWFAVFVDVDATTILALRDGSRVILAADGATGVSRRFSALQGT
jgi:hypothetical protein